MSFLPNLKDSEFRLPILLWIFLIINMGGTLLHSYFGPRFIVARGVIFIAAGMWRLLSKSPIEYSNWWRLFAAGVVFIGLGDLHSGLVELGVIRF
jgi:hypothetical protein